MTKITTLAFATFVTLVVLLRPSRRLQEALVCWSGVRRQNRFVFRLFSNTTAEPKRLPALVTLTNKL
jgi:hypothetical protein